MMETRLTAVDKAVEAMGKTMSDFRAVLLDLGSNKPLDEAHVTEVQAFAFRALKDMESYLNTEVNGRFLFAGSRATTRPADLGLTTMTDFQNRFDGESVIYPPTRGGARRRHRDAEPGHHRRADRQRRRYDHRRNGRRFRQPRGRRDHPPVRQRFWQRR